MAYHNQQPTTLTAAQLAQIAAATAAGGAFANSISGYSDAQATAWFNTSRTIANPIPQGQIAPATLQIADVFSLLTQGYDSAAFASLTGTAATVISNVYTAVSHYSGSGNPTMPYNLAATWLNEFVAKGLIMQGQANALLLIPDPSWVPTRAASAPIDEILGSDGWAVTVTGGVVG